MLRTVGINEKAYKILKNESKLRKKEQLIIGKSVKDIASEYIILYAKYLDMAPEDKTEIGELL
jgi:hypothetical protein